MRAWEARRKYLKPPQSPNVLWQVDITWVNVGDYGMHDVSNVIDYASRFPLISVFSSTVSDNGSQSTGKPFRRWIRDSAVRSHHIRRRSHHSQTIGMLKRYHGV